MRILLYSWNKTEEEKYLVMKREETILEKNSIRYDVKIEIILEMYKINTPLERITKCSKLSLGRSSNYYKTILI